MLIGSSAGSSSLRRTPHSHLFGASPPSIFPKKLWWRSMALLKGTLDVLVLKTLSWSPMHGFEIASWLEDRSAGRIEVTDQALLQALHRMEERGHLVAEWGVTATGRRARYYRLTAAGRATLRAEAAAAIEDAAALTTVLTARRADS